MLKKGDLPEIIFSSSDARISAQIGRLLEKGLIRKIEARIYTSNLLDAPNAIIRRNLFYIIGQLYPNVVLSYRSALEVRPSEKGNLYLSYTYTDNITLGDIQLKFIKGAGPLAQDNRLNGDLYIASLERACLENLRRSRTGADGERRALAASVIEERLTDILRIEGEAGLNAFRDRARDIAQELEFEKAFEKLHQKISALLSTKPSKILTSPQAIATALGLPYDAFRVELFWKLFGALQETSFDYLQEQSDSMEAFRHFAFFEAYFSNYIEGTEFEVEEAKDIVFKGLFVENRSGDSHDIKGTFELVSNPFEMRKIPANYEDLIALLENAMPLSCADDRISVPDNSNNAPTEPEIPFVEPPLVRGTLQKAFEPYNALKHPLARAIFMMFMVSEIHPFEDGNGRLARVMMNAELVKGNLTKIIIPTVYRDDYLLALRKLTRRQILDAYIQMMNKAQAFSHHLQLDDFDILLSQLERSDAFLEPTEGKFKFET